MNMNGLYLYCIRFRNGNTPRFKTVTPIPFKDIEAVAANVDLSQFSGKRLKEKLENDAEWAEKNVKFHHKVVAAANKTSAVVPMKFGALFKTKKSLEAMLQKHYKKFKDLLVYLRDKEEWGVKIYLDNKKFREQLKGQNKEFNQFEKNKIAMPEGMQWYAEKKADELLETQLDEEVNRHVERLLETLRSYSEDIALNSPLPSVRNGEEETVLNSAYLIKKGNTENFNGAARKIDDDFGPLGFRVEITGPWPPYNFVN
jgi:hypothetical protein